MIAVVDTTTLTVDVARMHRAAEKAYHSRNTKVAKRILRRCVRRNPRDGRAWELYGNVHHSTGNYPLAVAAFRRGARIVYLENSSRISLALSCANLGRTAPARRILVRLLQNDSLTANEYLQLAMGLYIVRQPHLSIHACRKALQADPECAQACYDLGYYCDKSGYPSTTVECLMRRALKLDSGNARYKIGLACLLCKADRSREAHRVVRDLGMTSIKAMTCSSCLQRLVQLYRRAKDRRRQGVCQQRLVELQLRGCGFEC
ncbi:MAG: tetratricopeptide repeat protein [Fuerstiella sp.]|nr:tetratricopeptide repeat protein [Fuerstiella sp.]